VTKEKVETRRKKTTAVVEKIGKKDGGAKQRVGKKSIEKNPTGEERTKTKKC